MDRSEHKDLNLMKGYSRNISHIATVAAETSGKKLIARQKDLELSIQQIELRIQQTESSLSWKVTKPLRYILRRIPGGLKQSLKKIIHRTRKMYK
jgi:hypothetical protein